MTAVVFTGPSFSYLDLPSVNGLPSYVCLDDIKAIQDIAVQENELYFPPPVSGGDVMMLLGRKDIKSIGIIDGYFENKTAIWHKEILLALSQGIQVYGASSMGALRAAELYSYGMVGVGKIFGQYKRGELEREDEVTVIHAHRALGYTALTEALVNIRYNLGQALSENVIDQRFHDVFLSQAKNVYYKNRDYGLIGEICTKDDAITRFELERFFCWLEKNRINQKYTDALALIHQVVSSKDSKVKKFYFEDSLIWRAHQR